MSEPAGGFLLGNAYGYVDLDGSGAANSLQGVKREFETFISSTGAMMQNWGRSIASFGTNLSLWMTPVAVAGGVGLKAASDFDSVLSEIQARTGLSADAMETVRATALQLGADTAFSSQQAADAFLQLLTAGLDVEAALATLPNVLDAAAAGGVNLGTAADLVTNVMSSFNLKAEDTTEIINALARASASSPANMEEMGLAMQRVGGLAQMFNLDLDKTAAILAIFAQNGIRGEEAGTQLRSLLLNLSSDTEATQAAWASLGTSLYDAQGNMRNLDDVLADIRVGLDRLPVARQNEIISQLAGSYGIVGFNALLASDGIAAMEETMAGQADASSVAAARMNTFEGSVDSLMGSVETFWITVLTPFMNNVLKPLAQTVTSVINAVTAWAAENEPLVQTIVSLVAGLIALGPILIFAGNAITLIGFAISTLLSPLGLAIAGVAALAAAYFTNFMGLKDFVDNTVMPALQGFFDWFIGAWDSFQSGGFDGLWTYIVDSFNAVDWTQLGTDILSTLGSAISIGATWVNDNLITPFWNWLVEGFQNIDWEQVGTTLLEWFGTAMTTLGEWGSWAYDNILVPLFDSAKTAISNIDWGQLGTDILNTLGSAFITLGEWATWAYDNILVPIFDSAKSAIESVDWEQVGSDIIFAIGDAIKATFDFIAWIVDSIFNPMTGDAENATGEVDWTSTGSSILNAIGSAILGFFNFVDWLADTVFGPMLSGAADAIATFDWGSIGTNLFNAIAEALPNIIQWVTDNIIAPIQNALAGFDPMASINNAVGGYSAAVNVSGDIWSGLQSGQYSWGQVGGAFLNAIGIPSNAQGLNYVPHDMLSLIHKGEAIVPAQYNPYNPNAQTNGLGGGVQFGDIIVYANTAQDARIIGESLEEKLEKYMTETSFRQN